LDNNQNQIISSATNASYNEMAFSGAEYYEGNNLTDGGVSRGDGVPTEEFTHTGNYSLKVEPGMEGFTYTLSSTAIDPSRKYWASVWVYLPGVSESNLAEAELNYQVGSSTPVKAHPVITKKAGSKYLINLPITVQGTTPIKISCKNNSTVGRSIYFDDFRIHPLDANVHSYVYDHNTGELVAILNNDNLYTRYEYNAAGKLVKTYQEIFHSVEKKVSSTVYNYGKPTN
jgi:YD repeat-containing protein